MTWYVALNSFPQLYIMKKAQFVCQSNIPSVFLAISKLFVMFTVFRFDNERKKFTFLRAFTNIMLFSSLLLYEQSVNAFYRVTY